MRTRRRRWLSETCPVATTRTRASSGNRPLCRVTASEDPAQPLRDALVGVHRGPSLICLHAPHKVFGCVS